MLALIAAFLLTTAQPANPSATTVDGLIEVSANDFRTNHAPRPAGFRNVRLGRIDTPDGERLMMCGEALLSNGGETGWTPFATIQTSPYEQWIGGAAVGLCSQATVRWDEGVDLTAALTAKVSSPD